MRSQDDHSVEYYGRQQNPVSAAGPFGSRRGWGVNSGVDDSVLGDVSICLSVSFTYFLPVFVNKYICRSSV